MLYRDKIKRGYIPNGKSQVVKNDSLNKNYFTKTGERNCMMCNNNFDMYLQELFGRVEYDGDSDVNACIRDMKYVSERLKKLDRIEKITSKEI